MQTETSSLSLEEQIAMRDADIVALGQRVRDLTVAMTAFEHRQAIMCLDDGSNQQLQKLQRDLDRAEHKLAKIYRSTSWRITAPIRKVALLIRD